MQKVIVQGPIAPLTIGFISADVPEPSAQREFNVLRQVSPKTGMLPAVAHDNVNSECVSYSERQMNASIGLPHPVNEEIRPVKGGLFAVCVRVALLCSVAAIATVLITEVGLLHALAVCFAAGNAIVLSVAVMMTHFCREYYDME